VSQYLCILEKNAEKLVENTWKETRKKELYIYLTNDKNKEDERKNKLLITLTSNGEMSIPTITML